jgi:predicted dehydrogenase
LIGSHGHLTIDENRPQLDIFSTMTERRGRTIGGDSAPTTVATEIHAFIRDIQEGRTPLYGARDAAATMATIFAAYESLRTGQPAAVTVTPAGV